MPGLNWIPGVSQVKSLCQLVTGDVEGARQTQEDFFRECPGISQSVALGQAIAGDTEGAEETFRRGIGTVSNVANGIPIVGHVKSGVHLICGDTEGASRAFQSANRSTVVLSTGVATGVLTGGVGAIPAAIAAGTTYDTMDSIVSDKPKGVIAAVVQVAEKPNAGNIFDATAMIASDGLSGYSGAKLGQQIAAKVKLNSLEGARNAKLSEANIKVQQKVDAQIELSNLETARVAKAELLTDTLGDGKGGLNTAQTLELSNEINSLTQRIDNIQTTQIEFTKGGEMVRMEVPGRIDVLNSEISALANEAQALNQNIAAIKPQAGGVVIEAPNLAALSEEEKTKQTSYTSTGQQQHERRSETESDSDSDEEDCTCYPVEVPVLYANMRSINPRNRRLSEKCARLREAIQRNDPAIIAIVETWLSKQHSDKEVARALGINRYEDGYEEGYEIWRQDRDAGHHPNNAYGDTTTGMEGRRGGGILIAWKHIILNNGNRLLLIRNPSEDFGDAIMSADIEVQMNCTECNEANSKKFAFTIVYRRPVPQGDEAANEINENVLHRLTHLGAVYTDVLNYSGWSMVGDFNWREGGDDENVPNLLMFVDGVTIFPDHIMRTHERGGCLDLLIASNGHVNGAVVSSEPISDHYALIYKLNFGTDYGRSEPCERCRRE